MTLFSKDLTMLCMFPKDSAMLSSMFMLVGHSTESVL